MRRGEIFWGAVLVLVGVLLLLGNVFDFNFWRVLGPVLIMALGVWIIWGVLRGPADVKVEEVTIPLEGVNGARIRLHYAAGRLFVDGSATQGNLVTGSFGGGVEQKVRRHGGRLNVVLDSASHVFVFPWQGWTPGSREWQVGLSPEIPFELDVETGASDARLNLENLQVIDLQLSTGASSTEIVLPASAGNTRVHVEAGAASVNIRVPEGVALNLRTQAGLSSVNVDGRRFPRVGPGLYKSPDYESAENRVEMVVESGVGSVSVR